MRPKNLEMNPQDHEFQFIAVNQGVGNIPTILVSTPDGNEWCVNSKEAKKIGTWFLKYAKWASQLEKV